MALLLAGCQKPEFVDPVGDNSLFEACTEAFEGQTRTSMNSKNQVVWSDGDRLSIFQGSSLADQYELKSTGNGSYNGSFKWVSSDNVVNSDFDAGVELPCNVAFYPYAEGLTLEGSMLDGGKKVYTVSTICLPEVQTYAEKSFANGAFPMVAVTQNVEDHNLKFKNILGVVRLSLKGTQTVKSIKVEGLNGEKLSGAATVTAYANNLNPVIKMSDEASTAVTLECGDGVQLNESEVTDFYIAVPPVLFEKGFNVTVADAADQEYTMTAGQNNAVLRSSILEMPEVILKAVGSDNAGDDSSNYIDEYGVNHGPGVEIDGVIWAPVNCGYHETDYKWGKLYQWGRKYGQGYDGDSTTPTLTEGVVSLTDGSLESNSNVFYYGYMNWLDPWDITLWNTGTETSPVKTEYDPCPSGWRVPTYNELSGLCQNYSHWTTNVDDQSGYWFSGTSSYTESVPQVFLPAAGYRIHLGDNRDRGNCGDYWSSKSYDATTGHAYDHLKFDNSRAYMFGNYGAYGYSVRCVKD